MPTPVATPVALGPQAPKADLECVLQMHLGYLGLGTLHGFRVIALSLNLT